MLIQYLSCKSRNLNQWVTFTYTNLLLYLLSRADGYTEKT
jgi:hypothetical protein